MPPFFPRSSALPLFVMLLASGCAITGKYPERVAYACDEGKTFVMQYSPTRDAALIEIAPLRFNLVRESTEPGGERFGCGMLTVEERHGTRQVLTEGRVTHQNCHPARADTNPDTDRTPQREYR